MFDHLPKIRKLKMSDEKIDDVKVEIEKEKVFEDTSKGNLLDVASGCLSLVLPAGYIEDTPSGLLLHDTAIVREMTGHEEDILSAKGQLSTKLSAIISNCLIQLGSLSNKADIKRAIDSLTAQDRYILLIAIRRVSLGDRYVYDVSCPSCKTVQSKSCELNQMEIIPMIDKMKREFVSVLPSGKSVSWHVLSNADEQWLSGQKKNADDRMTLGLLSRVDSIDNSKIDRVKGYRHALAALKNLSIRDRNCLRDIFNKEEGGIDQSIEHVCDECNHEWTSDLEIGHQSFFYPSDL